ncbi:MAG: hypothetical protein ABR879_04490 [Methanomassiliicoccales archaeon]|jgi:hypothetical protein
MDLSIDMIGQAILILLVVAVLMGIVLASTAVFEAVALARKGTWRGKRQDEIRWDIMPKVWGPMYEAIIGEVAFVLFAGLWPMDMNGRLLLLVVALIYAVIIVALGKFLASSVRKWST